MKKQLFGILALIVSITSLISLVSCSSKPSGSVDDDPPLVREDSTGSTSAPENNAGNVPDLSSIVAGNDGTWTMQGEDGQTTQLGGDWPDNEFTRLVPKPGFKLAGASTSDDEFSAAFQSVNVDQVKAYAEQVKASGFTVDAEEEDQNVYGVVVYTYSAYNADGYRVEVTFASGTAGITINK